MLRGQWPYSQAAAEFLRCDTTLHSLLHAILGEHVYLYNDQYIFKPAGSSESAFMWHRDSEGCSAEGGDCTYTPYISLWVALDDMTDDNGTLTVLPCSHLAAAGGACSENTRQTLKSSCGSPDGAGCAQQLYIAAGSAVRLTAKRLACVLVTLHEQCVI